MRPGRRRRGHHRLLLMHVRLLLEARFEAIGEARGAGIRMDR
jgi:hypothetical protein